MKNLKIIIVAMVVGAFVFVSCGKGSSVDAALSKIEQAMDKVEKNKTSMTEADWQALNEELEQPLKVLGEALESNKVGFVQKAKITAVMMRYGAVAAGAAFHTVTDKMEETHLLDSISDVGNKLQEALGGDDMKEAMQELQKAAEELGKIGK